MAEEKLSFVELATIIGLPLLALGFVIFIELTVGKDIDKSKKYLDRALQLEKDGLYLESLFFFRCAVSLLPTNSEAIFGLGRVYIKCGELDAAHKLLDTLNVMDKNVADQLKYIITNS